MAETQAAAAILGAQRLRVPRLHRLRNDGHARQRCPRLVLERAGWNDAARKLGAILQEEQADALTCYDDHGGYGHPDHIQVHKVGLRAARMTGPSRVYQATINRDQIRRGRAELAEVAAAAGIEIPDASDDEDFGKPEREITAAVDVSPYLDHKRRAMRAHASQISEHSFFVALPDEAFRDVFGTEWFIRDGQGPGITETDLLAGL